MKVINQAELGFLVELINSDLGGAQLQDVWTLGDGLVLHFYKKSDLFLVIDMSPAKPVMLLFYKPLPVKRQIQKKPVGLFLLSHGKNLFFKEAVMLSDYGRVLEIILSTSSGQGKVCRIEIRLIPHQANLLVESEDKKISWAKPIPLESISAPLDLAQFDVRSLRTLQDEWVEGSLKRLKKTKGKAEITRTDFESQKIKTLEKKQAALRRLEEDKITLVQPFEAWGETLKQYLYRTEFKSRQWIELLEQESVNSELIQWLKENAAVLPLRSAAETLFKLSKDQERKKVGIDLRMLKIEEEIQALKDQRFEEFIAKRKKGPQSNLTLTEVRLRKLNLPSGMVAYFGKSAEDNLKLLRSAKSWDYWLHLRDLPSSHAIVHRDRTQTLTDHDIFETAKWLIQETYKSKQLLTGQKFDIVITECRFVRPIKGDKLGRVHYSSERNMSYHYR